MIKPFKKINIFKIQSSYNNLNNNKLVYLFVKNFAIINIRILLKNYKKYIKKLRL